MGEMRAVMRAVSVADAEAIARIYNYYVQNSVITFEEELVAVQAMATRIAEIQGLRLPWIVAEVDGAVVGYAYARPWRPRSAYRYSVETTIYLEHDHAGRGLGTALYSALLPLVRERGMHVAIGGVALPNDASVALHERLGFEKVASFRQVGFKHDRWVDVAYWQLLL
jgi:L-amino acid N-acyltransferase YncA